MQIQIWNVLSGEREVTGEAVQGSILGAMDHNTVLKTVENSFELKKLKYGDDMTTEERIGLES